MVIATLTPSLAHELASAATKQAQAIRVSAGVTDLVEEYRKATRSLKAIETELAISKKHPLIRKTPRIAELERTLKTNQNLLKAINVEIAKQNLKTAYTNLYRLLNDTARQLEETGTKSETVQVTGLPGRALEHLLRLRPPKLPVRLPKRPPEVKERIRVSLAPRDPRAAEEARARLIAIATEGLACDCDDFGDEAKKAMDEATRLAFAPIRTAAGRQLIMTPEMRDRFALIDDKHNLLGVQRGSASKIPLSLDFNKICKEQGKPDGCIRGVFTTNRSAPEGNEDNLTANDALTMLVHDLPCFCKGAERYIQLPGFVDVTDQFGATQRVTTTKSQRRRSTTCYSLSPYILGLGVTEGINPRQILKDLTTFAQEIVEKYTKDISDQALADKGEEILYNNLKGDIARYEPEKLVRLLNAEKKGLDEAYLELRRIRPGLRYTWREQSTDEGFKWLGAKIRGRASPVDWNRWRAIKSTLNEWKNLITGESGEFRGVNWLSAVPSCFTTTHEEEIVRGLGGTEVLDLLARMEEFARKTRVPIKVYTGKEAEAELVEMEQARAARAREEAEIPYEYLRPEPVTREEEAEILKERLLARAWKTPFSPETREAMRQLKEAERWTG